MTAAGILTVIISAVISMPPKLIYNASASAPIGFYWVHAKGAVVVGDMVLVTLPPSFQDLVIERQYLPHNVPLVKRIIATEGDHVCAHDGAILINGSVVLQAQFSDSSGRPMPVWHGCRTLRHDEFFVAMSDITNSLDSRYFGPIDSNLIIGRLTPIWTSSVSSAPASKAKTVPLARSFVDASSIYPDAETRRTR